MCQVPPANLGLAPFQDKPDTLPALTLGRRDADGGEPGPNFGGRDVCLMQRLRAQVDESQCDGTEVIIAGLVVILEPGCSCWPRRCPSCRY